MEPFLPFKNFLHFQATPSLLPGAQPSLPASPSAGIIWGLHLSKDALHAAASPTSVPGLAQGAVAGWEDTESPRATKKKIGALGFAPAWGTLSGVGLSAAQA